MADQFLQNGPGRCISRWLPVALWLGMIYALSSVSGLRASQDDLLNFVIRKIAHLVEYGVLVVLFIRALDRDGKPGGRVYLYAGLAALVSAGLDEIHQRSVLMRVGSLSDVAVDCCGIALGLLNAKRALKEKQNHRRA